MATGDAPRRTFLFTFGIERLGLVALRAPLVSLILILAVSALALYGVSLLKVDDSLSELFRSDTKEFRQYEEIDRRFPSSEYDVLIAVDGPNILTRDGLQILQNAVVELQLTDGVGGLVSMLSARGKPDESGYAPPVVPDELPEEGPAFDAMLAALKSNDIVKGKFLSDDGQLALIVIALDRKVVEELSARTVITGIQEVVDKELEGTGMTAKLTGAPVMQLEIRNAVERDRLVYNGLGFLAGIIVAYLFFRRISLTLIAVLGPSIAILWTLGVVGGLDYRLNLFINVITPLILVQGFSDSMHLVSSIRRDILAGVDRLEAARNAVRDVAPACLLTAMNAGIAILSFQYADSALIRTFGQAALLAVAISYIAVAVVVPTLAVFFKTEVEKRTGGSVTVAIFPQGQLGNDAAMIDGARSGIIGITMSGLNNFTGLVPAAGALELPFMFPTRDLAYSVLDGAIGQGISGEFTQHGLKVLGYPENGYRSMTNNRGPIRVPADVSGLNMRVNNSKALNDMFALLGANPTQLPVAELYTALETGVVDAQDHPIGIVLSFKFNEVQKYLSLTRHAYSALALVMNDAKFNSLTADEQKVIADVAAEAVAMQRKLAAEKEAGMIEQLKAAGMEVNDDVDAAAFQAAVKPVWDGFVAQNGDTVVNAIAAAQK